MYKNNARLSLFCRIAKRSIVNFLLTLRILLSHLSFSEAVNVNGNSATSKLMTRLRADFTTAQEVYDIIGNKTIDLSELRSLCELFFHLHDKHSTNYIFYWSIIFFFI